MCLECSGRHRSLGVHISFVRSVAMDSWNDKQVKVCCCFTFAFVHLFISTLNPLFVNPPFAHAGFLDNAHGWKRQMQCFSEEV